MTARVCGPLLGIMRAEKRDLEASLALHVAVQVAHDAGHSWADIGAVLGISRRSAWERFSKEADE